MQALTGDPVFWKALWNTFYYAAISVPLGLAVGLWLANLLNKRVRGRKFFRTMIYLPTLVPLVATAMVFKMVLAPSGPLNDLLGVFGGAGPPQLAARPPPVGQARPGRAVGVGARGGAPPCCSSAP